MNDPWPYQKVKCPDCGWTGKRCEGDFENNRIYCPECDYEPLPELEEE